MRSLTYLLVVASLAFSTGGVALRSSADPAPTAKAEAVSQDAEPAVCRLPAPSRVRTQRVVPLPGGPDAILLNSRGYNYTDPGRAVPTAPHVAPRAQPQTPPAASE